MEHMLRELETEDYSVTEETAESSAEDTAENLVMAASAAENTVVGTLETVPVEYM